MSGCESCIGIVSFGVRQRGAGDWTELAHEPISAGIFRAGDEH